jgi:hypothetical protein
MPRQTASGPSWTTERDRRRGWLLAGTPHVSDGVVALPDGPAGGIAVELELSDKTTEEYGRILRWYGAALDYRRVRWFCRTPAIRGRLADLVERERMGDFIVVEALPVGLVPGARC